MVMVVSAITLVLCHRLRLPVVLGYILAGLVIGPHTPPYSLITDLHSIHTLSTLGVIFLLFSIGLEFSFTKLARVGAVAFIAATIEIIFMISIGFSLGKMLGWGQMNSLFLGAILSISSTTIIAKILMENKKVNEKFAQIILGILVVEDLWAIVIIAILSGIATTGALTATEISISMVKVFAFVTAILFFGFLAVPRVLRYIERFQMAEMMIVVVLGLCLGVSLIAAKAGFSIALGAFLIGAVIAETKQVHGILSKMEPIRDMFTAIFFVSVGMLIDPAVIVRFAPLILIITVVAIIGKVFICSLATFLVGYDSQTSLRVGLGLAQIGEFSFIIAQLGRDTEVTTPYLYPIAVAVSAITTISTPFLMNSANRIIGQIKRFAPKPLVTTLSLYPAWISKIGQSEVSSQKKLLIYRDIKRHLPQLCVYAACVVVVYFTANKYAHLVPIDRNLYWAIVLLVVFQFFVGCAYSLDKIFWEGIILNVVRSKAEISKAKETGELFRNVSRFFGALITGLLFIGLAAHVFPAIPLDISAVILVLACGTFLLRSVIRIHENIEKTVMGIFDHEKPLDQAKARSDHDQLLELIRRNYPLSFETQDFILPYQECGVNRTIKELDLRFKTGASIVGIFREEDTISNPAATTDLLPGDVLLLIGDAEQIKAAIRYLQERIREPQ